MKRSLGFRTGARGDVVYVAPYFPPDLGGMERVAEELARRVSRRRQVTVLTSTSRNAATPATPYPPGMTVRRLPTLRIAQIPLMPTLAYELAVTPRSSLIHVHVAQTYPPEMVWLVSKVMRRPYVAHFHLDVEPSTRLGPMFLLYKRLVLARVLRAAVRVVALNAEQRDVLQRRYGVAPHRISIIPNGVSSEFLELPGPVAHEGPLRLLFVGRLSAQKNVSRLLNAMALVRSDVELTIVGDGPDRLALDALATALGLTNVRLVGAARGSQLLDWYRWADALALTSEHEGMPLVLLEAMAAGIPIIATDVPGVTSTIGDAGIVVKPAPAQIAAEIDRLASDANLRQELSVRAAERAATYGWDRVIDAMDDLYHAVAG